MTDLNGQGEGLQAFQFVAPSETGFAVNVKEVAPGVNFVVLRLETMIGSLVFLVPPDAAKDLGKSLQNNARTAKLGLTIVGDAE